MYELRVLNGLYQGASLPLVGMEWIVGTSEQNDLAIFEPGLTEGEIKIKRSENNWFQNESPISVNTPWKREHIWFIICHATTPWDSTQAPDENQGSSSQLVKKKSAFSIFLFAFLSLVLCIWALSSIAKDEVLEVKTMSQPTVHYQAPELAREVLQTMLKERELKEIQVIITETHLGLHGELTTDEELSRLKRMVKRFEDRYNSRLPVENNVTLEQFNMPFDIAQVTSGALAHIVLGSGERLFVGDKMNGIELVAITDQYVVFNGDSQLKMAW